MGVTQVGLQARFQQHGRPSSRTRADQRMQADDAAAGLPFAQCFACHVIGTHSTRKLAEPVEQQQIRQRRTTDPARGYNSLPACPRLSKQYWAIQTARQRNRRLLPL